MDQGRTEGSRLLLSFRSLERVERGSDLHVDEARFLEERDPACARQATGYSAGPEIDVAQSFLGNGTRVGDIGELEDTAASQDPE